VVLRVTNCILVNPKRDEVLLLQKPRRGWWVAPGGKMEPGETILESVKREFKEETGITLHHPVVRGVFTILVEEEGRVQDEWMLFTFFCDRYEGDLVQDSPEGRLAWVPVKDVAELPKAEGDQIYFRHILELKKQDLLILRFRYTRDYQLIACE
jgi:8-oxo-dGTP diphosphatase